MMSHPDGIYDSFPRPYIVGKVVGETQTIETDELNGIKVTLTEL